MSAFDKNVFINCPFDDDYRQLLLSLVFTTKFLGFIPRLTLEKSDSGITRIANIINLIESSKFGIHDLSRILSSKEGEHARMNMPFELGVDFGCKQFKSGKWAGKKILILEKEKYRIQAALSDLSGSDIKNHNNEPMDLVLAVKNWFVTEELNTGPSHKKIWYDFNDFSSDLAERLEDEGHEPADYDQVQISEVMAYMDIWFKNHA
ncbi:MAG: hypothetical protein O6649_03080 [Gammaproteobacteria bacterium]|nr:hypothetical protein [Gammaproteobacteria bacterium]